MDVVTTYQAEFSRMPGLGVTESCKMLMSIARRILADVAAHGKQGKGVSRCP